MDVVPKPPASVDAAQWEEKVKAYHLPRAEINKVSVHVNNLSLATSFTMSINIDTSNTR